MPTFTSFADLNAQFEKLSRAVGDEGARRVVKAMGDEARKIVRRELEADAGSDLKFRNWKPVMETKVLDLEIGRGLIAPTRAGAGPITVLNQGRNQGNASGFSGPGINVRTGVTARTKSGGLRKVRARKAKRWNGTTQGKGSADRAVAMLESELPKVAEREYLKLLRGFFDVD